MPGPWKAIHAAAILLARVIGDSRSCVLLLKRGYVGQASGVVAGSLELVHTSLFIGADEGRVAAWFAHDDPTKSYPGSVKQAIQQSGARAGAPPEAVEREYDETYRELCMMKHGNPMALSALGIVIDENTVYVIAGPVLTPTTMRRAHAAMGHMLRYLILPSVAFVQDHVTGVDRTRFALELGSLADRHQRLLSSDIERFDVIEPGSSDT